MKSNSRVLGVLLVLAIAFAGAFLATEIAAQVTIPSVSLDADATLTAIPVAADSAETSIAGWLAFLIPLVVTVSAGLSTFLPSKARGALGVFMRLVDAFALNWGKARNDPAGQ